MVPHLGLHHSFLAVISVETGLMHANALERLKMHLKNLCATSNEQPLY